MKKAIFGVVAGLCSLTYAAEVTTRSWTTSEDMGVQASKTYTHAVNMVSESGGVTLINGVPFLNTKERNTFEKRPDYWRVWRMSTTAQGESKIDAGRISGDATNLVKNVVFNNSSSIDETSQIDIGGLVPGKTYRLTVVSMSWDKVQERKLRLEVFGDELVSVNGNKGDFIINPNQYGVGGGFLLELDYTAPADGEIRLQFKAVSGPSMIVGAFYNEVIQNDSSALKSPAKARMAQASRPVVQQVPEVSLPVVSQPRIEFRPAIVPPVENLVLNGDFSGMSLALPTAAGDSTAVLSGRWIRSVSSAWEVSPQGGNLGPYVRAAASRDAGRLLYVAADSKRSNGSYLLRFDYILTDSSDALGVKVFVSDRDITVGIDGGDFRMNSAQRPADITLLPSCTSWTTYYMPVELGSGYNYIYVLFAGSGSGNTGIDNISLSPRRR
jgi:hypothetical protein